MNDTDSCDTEPFVLQPTGPPSAGEHPTGVIDCYLSWRSHMRRRASGGLANELAAVADGKVSPSDTQVRPVSNELQDELKDELSKDLVVLLLTGSFNPIHNMHLYMFLAAREYLESNYHCRVVAGYISPSHDQYVKSKLGSHAIDACHRLAMCRLAVETSHAYRDWLVVDDWEASRDTFVDFMDVAEHLSKFLQGRYHGRASFKVMFLCGSDHYIRCHLHHHSGTWSAALQSSPLGDQQQQQQQQQQQSPAATNHAASGAPQAASSRELDVGVVCVPRPCDNHELLRELRQTVQHLAHDTATTRKLGPVPVQVMVSDRCTEDVSSTAVRSLLEQHSGDVSKLMPPAAALYHQQQVQVQRHT